MVVVIAPVHCFLIVYTSIGLLGVRFSQPSLTDVEEKLFGVRISLFLCKEDLGIHAAISREQVHTEHSKPVFCREFGVHERQMIVRRDVLFNREIEESVDHGVLE